jgi:hypothetical protein
MRPDSGIDLLMEFLPEAHIDLVDYTTCMLDSVTAHGAQGGLGFEEGAQGVDPSVRAQRGTPPMRA